MLSTAQPACFLIADISGYTGYLADVELERAELKPRDERIFGEELNLPVDAVVREHPVRRAEVEVRGIRRAERREAAGRVEDRVGACDRAAKAYARNDE